MTAGPSDGARTRGTVRRARSDWERASDVWEDFEESGKDVSRDHVHGPSLLRAIGPVRDLRVLDLGCGQGRFTRNLARRGGRVTGIDWSRRMIDHARRHERDDPLGIRFVQADARTVGRRWAPRSFDLVVSCMALMDMPGLPRVLRGLRSVLRPGGRLVFSISHPINSAESAWGVRSGRGPSSVVIDRYFEERVGRVRWVMPRLSRPFATTYWHRTLETWFTDLARAGFAVDGLWEPRPTAAQARRIPLLRPGRGVPFFLVFRCHSIATADSAPGGGSSPRRRPARRRR